MGAGKPRAPRSVIVISSHVARGSVGNRAAVFALETLGHPVWAVPTVILPWHPGHGRATRIVPDDQSFAALLRDLETSRWLDEVGAVLTGYLGTPAQAKSVASLVDAVKRQNPSVIYVCDPVIGDKAGLYVPEALAISIREHLLPRADIATPNRYELEWLTGSVLDTAEAIVAAASSVGPDKMLVTSAPAAGADGIANLLLTPSRAFLAEHPLVENPPNGLGDLTAAVFLARLMAGEGLGEAVHSTTAAVFEILSRTAARGGDELQIETDAKSLSRPVSKIRLHELSHPARNIRPVPLPDIEIAGVDGCKAGWIAVVSRPGRPLESRIFARFSDLVDSLSNAAIIAVDMPIGLPDRVGHGGRGPERLVREKLGQRQSSVFSIPSRDAVHAETADFTDLEAWYDAHRRASAVARATSEPPRAISIQAFGIFSKIRELDALLRERPELAERVIESHPEAAFWRLNGEKEMTEPKKVKGRIHEAGMAERRDLLAGCGIPYDFLDAAPPRGCGEDDFLDAAAVMLVAARHARGEAVPFPDPPGRDSHGLPIAIWT